MRTALKRKAFIGMCLSSLLLFSCINFGDLHIPETIAIETHGAIYSVPLGNGKADLAEHLNVEKIREQMEESITSEDASFSVFDYNPESKAEVQEYLVKYDLQSIDLNMTDVLNKIKLEDLLSEGLSNEISVPQEDLTFTEELDFDFNEIIKNSFTAIGIDAVPFPERGTDYDFKMDSAGIPSVDMSVTPSFNTLKLRDGKMIITVTAQSTPTPGYTLLAKAKLFSKDSYIASSASAVDITHGGVIEIPVAGKLLSDSLSVFFEGSMSGGVPGHFNYYSLSCKMDSLDIEKVTGITLEDAEDLKMPINNSVSFAGVAEYVISAKVKEGYLDLKTPLPGGWSGITTVPDITISGALDIDELPDGANAAISLLDKHIDLADKLLTPSSDLFFTGEVAIVLKDATIDLSDGTPRLAVEGTGSIASLKEAKVDASKIEITNSITKDAPDDLVKYVKEMMITEIAIGGTVISTLDAEDLVADVSVTSDFFKMEESSDTAMKTQIDLSDDGELDLRTKPSWQALINLDSDPVPPMDFTCAITVNSQTDVDTGREYILLNTVELGKTYLIEAMLTMDKPEWEYIILKADSTSIAKPGEKETGLNLKTMVSNLFSGDSENEERQAMIEDLVDQLELTGIEAYAYVVRPKFQSSDGEAQDPLAGLGDFSAYIYAKGSNVEETPLLGTSSDDKQPLRLLSSSGEDDAIDYESLADENFLITKNIFKDESNYSAQLSKDGISYVINKKPDNLVIGYDIGLANSSEIRLTPADLDNLSGEMSIKMSIGFRIPLMVHIGKMQESGNRAEVVISDLMLLVGSELEDDLLKRSESDLEDDSTINKFSRMFKYIRILYTLENNTGLSMTSKLIGRNEATGEKYLQKTLEMDNKQQVVEFSAGEIATICQKENYPFIPKFELTIDPTGEVPIKIPRTAYFSAKDCIAFVETDGVYVVKEK